MKKYTLLGIFISLSAYTYGQGLDQQINKPVLKQTKTSTQTDQFEQWLLQNISPNHDFQIKKLDSNKDIAGNTHIRYQQYYKDLPVETSMINLHCKENIPISFNGIYYPKLDFDLSSAKIGTAEAIKKAKNTFPAQSIFAWEERATGTLKEQGLLEIDQITSYPTATEVIIPIQTNKINQFRLSYQFKLLSAIPLSYKSIFVDAEDGTILLCKDLIYHLDKPGIAHTKYSGIQNITCDSIDSNKYTLIERTRGLDSIIIKQSGGISPSKLFYDDDNNWNNFNPQKDEIATDIFWGFEQTYDYYKTRFSRNSYDDKGHAVQGNTHPIGKSESAYWIPLGAATFGDGDDTVFNAWVSIDIVAHEFTHGVTDNTARLNYEKESGALSESYSDIFGKCIENYAIPDSFTWDFGKPIMLNGHQSIRSFSDPNSRKHPKYYKGKYYNDTSSYDNYGVHSNSSVQNYWFYLLSEGGVGTRETDSRPYNVRKIGMDTAAIIAYYTLTNYLTPTSTFTDAASNSIAATRLLFGDSSHLVQETINAWYAVGVLNSLDIETNKAQTATNKIHLYPNPTKDLVYLESDISLIGTQFTLYDIIGKAVQMEMITTNQYQVSVNLSNLPSGLYLLETYQLGEREIFKVQKK